MQAQVRLIDCYSHTMRMTIELVCNHPEVNVISPPRSNGKYKKVTLEARLALQAMVRQGSSIIDVHLLLCRLLVSSTSIIRRQSQFFKTLKQERRESTRGKDIFRPTQKRKKPKWPTSIVERDAFKISFFLLFFPNESNISNRLLSWMITCMKMNEEEGELNRIPCPKTRTQEICKKD